MAEKGEPARTLPKTPSWAVALVFAVMIIVSVLLEHVLQKLGHWFHKRHKNALAEALEKMKAELMLVGFISLLLTVAQDPISRICISKEAANVMWPWKLPLVPSTASTKTTSAPNSCSLRAGTNSFRAR